MKKLFSFIMLLALTATTAFVFASSKKFANEGLYAEISAGNYKQLSSESGTAPSGVDVQVGTSRPISVVTSSGSHNLKYFNGSSYQQVETIGSW